MKQSRQLAALLSVASLLPIVTHADPFVADFTFGGGCSIRGYLPVPQVNGFDYCFTEVGIDSTVLGEGVTIDSIEASAFGDNSGAVINFDWEIYLGSAAFGLPEGQFIQTTIDPVTGYTRTAPTIFHPVIGEQFDTNDYLFATSHDFGSGISTGDPFLSTVRSVFTSPIDTTDGLYAQMFLWTADNRDSNIVFGDIVLTVRGNIENPTSVPEPSTLALLSLGLLGLGLSRRRKQLT